MAVAGWSWKIDFHAHDLSSIKGCFWWKGFIGCWSIHFSLLTAHRSFLKPSPRGLINDWINLVLMIVLKECYRPILMYHASYQVREFSNLPRRLFASALGVGRTGGGRRDHKWNWFRKFHSRWWRTFVIGLIHFIIIVLTKLSRIKSGILCRMYTTSITYLTFVEKSYSI